MLTKYLTHFNIGILKFRFHMSIFLSCELPAGCMLNENKYCQNIPLSTTFSIKDLLPLLIALKDRSNNCIYLFLLSCDGTR